MFSARCEIHLNVLSKRGEIYDFSEGSRSDVSNLASNKSNVAVPHSIPGTSAGGLSEDPKNFVQPHCEIVLSLTTVKMDSYCLIFRAQRRIMHRLRKVIMVV